MFQRRWLKIKLISSSTKTNEPDSWSGEIFLGPNANLPHFDTMSVFVPECWSSSQRSHDVPISSNIFHLDIEWEAIYMFHLASWNCNWWQLWAFFQGIQPRQEKFPSKPQFAPLMSNQALILERKFILYFFFLFQQLLFLIVQNPEFVL